MRHFDLVLLLQVALGTCLCCPSAAQSVTNSRTSDSLGVRVVQVEQELSLPEWTVDSEPELTVGHQGGPMYDLYQVKGAFMVGKGSVKQRELVVANGGDATIRFYSPTGEHVRTVGGRGGGPGEFAQLTTLLRLRGDSLLAFDRRRRSAVLFDASGVYAGRVSLGGVRMYLPSMLGRLPDGTYLVQDSPKRFGPESQTLAEGTFRDTAVVLHVSMSGTLIDTLGRFPNTEHSVEMRRPPGGGPEFPRQALAVFSPVLVIRLTSHGTVVAWSDRYEYRVYDSTGRLRQVVRRTVPREHIRSEDLEEGISDMRRALVREDAPDVEGYLQQVRRAKRRDFYPAFDGLFSDNIGNVWIGEYKVNAVGNCRFTVFEPNGAPIATVEVPRSITVVDIGSDYIVGVARDALDVEQVEVYALHK